LPALSLPMTTTNENIDVRGRIYDGVGPDVDVLDDLSISGTINVDTMGENDIEGYLNLGTATSANNQGDSAMSGEMTVGNNLIIYGSGTKISDKDAAYTEFEIQNNHLVVRDGTDNQFFMVYDSSGNQYVSLDMSQGADARVLVSSGDLLLQTNDDQDQYLYFTMAGNEPYLGTQGGADFRINTDGDEVTIVDGDSLYVDTNTLYVDAANDRVGVGTVTPTHTLEIFGTARTSDDLTVSGSDIYFGANDNAIHFEDDAQRFAWDDSEDEFGLTDDLSVADDLTIWGSTRLGNTASDTFALLSSGITIAESGTIEDTDSAVRFNDDVSITGELSINDDVIIYGSGVSGFDGGRMYIGSTNPSILAQQSGDLYVEGDVEIGGDISIANDVTFIGVIFTNDFFAVMGNLSASKDIDVRGRLYNGGAPVVDILDNLSVSGDLTVWGRDIYVGGTDEDSWIHFSDGGEQLFWDESDSEFDTTDDLFLNGDLTVISGAHFGDDGTDYFVVQSSGLNIAIDGTISDNDGLVVMDESLSVNGDVTVTGARIHGGFMDPIDLGATNQGVIEVTGDATFSGDVTIGGNLSVNDFPGRWVEEIGDTMSNTLYINMPGGVGTGLDVDGDIEYTGKLRNQSPVNIADGLAITNLGGIQGGQLLLKDVIVALTGDMFVAKENQDRTLVIPDIAYLRFVTNMPEISSRNVDVTIDISKGYVGLPLNENQHIVAISAITCEAQQQYFMNNVGLDDTIKQKGDYSVRGQRGIAFIPSEDAATVRAQVMLVVREDTKESGVVEHALAEQTRVIDDGWHIVYIKEIPLNEISAHDTAAMSTTTQLELHVVPMHTFKHSADIVVVGVVTDDDSVNQYF